MKCPACGNSLWFVRTSCAFCKVNIKAPPRPRSVTNIGWTLIAFGGLSLLGVSLNATSEAATKFRTEHPFAALHFYAGPIVALVCGTVILRGMNWARWLFLVWFGYNGISHCVTTVSWRSPLTAIGPVLFATTIYFLWRPAATAFFCEAPVVAPESVRQSVPACAECGIAFPLEDMVRVGTLYTCAACKPAFVQKLREGVGYGSDLPEP